MTPVVIDASAGAEIVSDTRRGRALAQLLPIDAEGWVPEHFYAEVLGVVRRRTLIEHTLTETEGTVAVSRLHSWHLHKTSVVPLLDAGWAYRHNITAADALYVVLAEHLNGEFLTDDHHLVDGPTFPRSVKVRRLGPRR